MSIDPQNPPPPPAPASGPLETKVAASAAGAGGGVALSAVVVYLLDMLVYTGGRWGEDVPAVVTTAVAVVFAAIGSLVAGYRAPHTRR